MVVLGLAHRKVGRVAQTVVFASHVSDEKFEELLMVGAQKIITICSETSAAPLGWNYSPMPVAMILCARSVQYRSDIRNHVLDFADQAAPIRYHYLVHSDPM